MNGGKRVHTVTVTVLWSGRRHEITVEGGRSIPVGFDRPIPVGFGGAASGDPPEATLHFTCDECGDARFHFVAPDSGWSRPFVVRSVRHVPDE